MISRCLLLLLLGAASFAQAGGVFWTDRGVSQLKRMNFDGTSLQTISLSGAVTVPGSNIRGIAVDIVSNRVFWADNGADRLLRANFDGSGTVILYTIAGGNSFPADVRLDLGNQLFYWCDQLRNRIQRSTLNGANVIDVITNAAGTGPYFMDVDPPAGKIYWGDFNVGSIFRANLDGTSRETLLTGNNLTRGVCLDTNGQMLYWINRDAGKVHRCPLSAFNSGTITITHPAVQTLYSNLDTPHGLVLDIPARKLYWADTGSNGTGEGGRTVSRGDLDGSTAREILANGSEPWDCDLDRRCTNYTEWVRRCFRIDALATDTDPSADPDGDGIPNAIEYALNLSPTHPDTSGLPQGFLTVGPTQLDYHATKFRRRTGTTDLTYYVQVSTNLTSWSGSPADPQTVEIQKQPLGDDMEEVTVRTTYAISGYSSHFMTLRVELMPSIQ
jgi:sugar lactone lactonase YvrE